MTKVTAVVSPLPKPWDIDCSRDIPLAKQEFKDDCDINVIISRCLKSGLPLPSVVSRPLFADVSEVGSYADCVRRVKAAENAFMNLPASIRSEFGNEPSVLIAFLADPRNRPRAIELGLVDPPKAVPVPAVPAVLVPPALPVVPPTK